MPEKRLAKILGASTLSFFVIVIILVLSIIFQPKKIEKVSQNNLFLPEQKETSQNQEVAGVAETTSENTKLVLGETEAKGEKYIVEAGDTLYSISLQFGINWKKIADANGIIDQTSLRVGQELIIPSD